MKHLHFLAAINDDSWLGSVGTLLLLSFGPESCALIQQNAHSLSEQRCIVSAGLDSDSLVDFSVRQVSIDGMASDELVAFSEQVSESDNPVAVPDELLKNVLLGTDEYDELRAVNLSLFRQGTLEVTVSLATLFSGRPFLMDGAITLPMLRGSQSTHERKGE